MKKRLQGLLTLLLVLVVQISFAQEKTVTGTVIDEDGLPLPGVNVIEKGTSNGVQTDFDGNYSITVGQGDVLVFSYLGFATQESTVGSSDVMDITMSVDAAALDEVVVVGYGTATKQSFAGTATTVSAENLEVKAFSNISQALAGEVAGVNVINTSGQPGTASTIRIRGFGSVNGNRDPLYVVDGVPFSGSINSINPSDIKSTTILKDATATAIYGARGANGVVLITTKSGGAAGDDYIEVDVRTGVNDQLIPRYNVVRSPEEYIAYVWEGIYNRADIEGSANPTQVANQNLFTDNYVPAGYNMWNVADGGELINPETRMVRDGVTRRYTPESFIDEAFDSAIRTEANVRFGGGNEKTTYFASAGYLNDDGYSVNTGYDRYTTRLNVKSDVKEWLEVGANIGYTYSESLNNGQTVGSENVFEFADKTAPIFPVFLRDNNYERIPDPVYGGFLYDYGSSSNFRTRPQSDNLNPIGSALYDFNGTDRHEINGNFSLNIDITENLVFETRFGAQYYMDRFTSASNPFYGTSVGEGGSLFKRDREVLTTNFLQLLRYTDQFGDHSIEALAAHETNDYDFTENNAFKTKVVLPGLYELNNYVVNPAQPEGFNEGRSIESFFGQVNYDYDDRYYLTGSVRRDGSSRFVNEKWGTFGSVGAAWVLTNEDFLYNNSFLTFLKLKGSYGVTGDQAGVGFYSGFNTFDLGNLNGNIAVSVLGNGNPDLTWETSYMTQAGVEFSLGRWLDGSVDYYIKNTQDQIFSRRVGPSQGIAIITVNDGDLRNTGLEFNLTGHLVKTRDFSLDLNINGEILSNEITKMPLEPSTGEPRILDTSNAPFAYSEGRSIYDIFTREWAGVDPANGAPLWYQYFDDVDGNGTFGGDDVGIQNMVTYLAANPDATVEKTITDTYVDATEKYIGKSGIPDVRGGARLSASWKNFNFSTQLLYSFGGYAIDFQYAELMSDRFGAVGNNYHTDIANRWQRPGDITDVPRLADAYDPRATSTSTRFVTSTDYITINNALIGYTLDGDSFADLGIDNMNIFVSGDNLFAETAREGFLPFTREDGNSGRRLYAPLTTFTMGVRVKF
ncbi:TonB-linked SusC/RagA family outer membrane protein [Christiangramia gaetbulicola]|uniref:TonB-linked SusC/RagA family outer membrane protein n=1 Tax=Christiangramia gaetbulicola TaxID=703340 RepID=A0A2T6AD88_9FLAO|nr:SusC/RagA family TonB-linked outer membrane protein [Christiangramia gaetbulicola]PTX41732.1 TonB-linked SusC/RagA family outer membrane protein [Christiangramia gaetbulicola]